MVPALHSPQPIPDVPLGPDWAKLGWGINATGRPGCSLHGETEARSSRGPTQPAQRGLLVPPGRVPPKGGRPGSWWLLRHRSWAVTAGSPAGAQTG